MAGLTTETGSNEQTAKPTGDTSRGEAEMRKKWDASDGGQAGLVIEHKTEYSMQQPAFKGQRKQGRHPRLSNQVASQKKFSSYFLSTKISISPAEAIDLPFHEISRQMRTHIEI